MVGWLIDADNYAYSKYACQLGSLLLNGDYVMLPFGELDRRKEFLFAAIGRENRVFMRPDSPLKLFTGQVVTRDTFTADLEFMGFYEFPVDSLVVVSSPKTLLAEWRFVVAGGRVVTGCRYKLGDDLVSQAELSDGALQLAQRVAASQYQPDPVWILDICETSERSYHVLEIGGFSFSDLYACDVSKVVAAVSQAAQAEWGRSQGRA